MAKNTFIYETLNDVKGMNVKKQGDFMTLSGVFGVCGVKNNNARIYETSNYAKMVKEMQERIKAEGGIPGELEHPQMMNITLENISHKITDINIDENGVVSGSITLLNTPKGQIAQAIVEGGLPLYISSRATGNVDSRTGMVTLEKLATYDLVGSPGFSQAKLHLNENQIAEAINESVYYITEKEEEVAEPVDETKEEIKENNTEIEDMEAKEILERLEALENKVTALEQENAELRTIANENVKELASTIQNWIVEEYSPVLQNWVVEEFAPEMKDEITESIDNEKVLEEVKDMLVKNVAPAIQKWVVEEYSPEVQNYITEEVAPVIENYIVEEIAPGIQKWIVEEYSPNVDAYLTEAIKNKTAELVAESKASNLDSIDSTLKLLESMEGTKPTYQSKTIVTEASNEPLYIAQMPAEARVKWDLADDAVKESIHRRARLYNFANEGAVQRFWENINFEGIKPINSVYEGLEKVEDNREKMIRESLRKWRRTL